MSVISPAIPPHRREAPPTIVEYAAPRKGVNPAYDLAMGMLEGVRGRVREEVEGVRKEVQKAKEEK
ncbi:hypothetical protein HK102_007000, partial [Quaeritorhiza haematococci]